jgi:hypothetical protein
VAHGKGNNTVPKKEEEVERKTIYVLDYRNNSNMHVMFDTYRQQGHRSHISDDKFLMN